MKRQHLAAVAALIAIACVDGGRSPSGPNFAISDATHGTGARNAFFYWLPPLVPNPNATGTFNPFASPVVTVCELASGGAACALSGGQPILVAQFTKTAGTGGAVIGVSASDYHVNWRTDLSNLDPAKTYRIGVAVDGRDYGFADVEVGANASELKNVNRNEFVPLVDGRTLPIRFRIEAGAACAGREAECAEAIVDPRIQQVVTLHDGDVPLAFADFPPGWTNGPQSVRIERIPDGDFAPGQGPLGTTFPQYPLFFHYFTSAPEPFNRPVRIGVCNVEDPSENPYHAHHRGTTVLAMGGTPQEFRVLPFAAVNDVLGTCHGAEKQPPSNVIGALQSTGWGELAARAALVGASLLAPRALEASAVTIDGGMGGSTDSFTPAGTVDTLPLADLTIHDLTVTPGSVVNGGLVTLAAVVTNGGGTSAGPATVNLCAVQFFPGGGSGGTCAQPLSPTLAPGASAPISAEVSVFGIGTHSFLASVDTFNVVPESNETNNTAVGPDFLVTAPPPTIDGVISEGEWDAATQQTFVVHFPAGDTAIATLYVRNDADNLYLAVQYPRVGLDSINLLGFEFDLNNNGTGPEDGDEYFNFQPTTGFSDAYRSGCVPGPCGVTTDGTHGFGAFANGGGVAAFELVHALNSGETGKDFAITSTTTVGLLLQLTVGTLSATTTTRYPSGPFPTYTPITITLPSP